MKPPGGGHGGTIDGPGSIAYGIPGSVSRRGGLRSILVRTALAGRLRLPSMWRRARGSTEEPGPHVRMSRLRSSDLDHGRQRDASLQAPADGLVLGRTSDVDALQRDVGAAVGGSTRPHLQDRLVADTEAAAIDGRSGQGTPRRGR